MTDKWFETAVGMSTLVAKVEEKNVCACWQQKPEGCVCECVSVCMCVSVCVCVCVTRWWVFLCWLLRDGCLNFILRLSTIVRASSFLAVPVMVNSRDRAAFVVVDGGEFGTAAGSPVRSQKPLCSVIFILSLSFLDCNGFIFFIYYRIISAVSYSILSIRVTTKKSRQERLQTVKCCSMRMPSSTPP